MKRVLYAQSVHGQEEIDAVLGVLNGGPQALRIGENVQEMERQVAHLFGKSAGLMCNSGSSAIYLAFELLNFPPGSEVITTALTFSTDVAALVRAGLVPVFVDVEADTFNADVTKIEALIGPLTRALFFPNLIGNAPDWDAIRSIADVHHLAVVEDSCDALGAKLRGSPTGTRSDLSVTSFAMSHIITCAGTGGMVMLNSEELRDRGLLLRRWGRRSETNFFGSGGKGRVFKEDLDGIDYDNDFIFDVLPWNFEPSELGAAFGLQQLKKLKTNYRQRQQNFAVYSECLLRHPDAFIPPRQLEELETAWLCYPFLIAPGSGIQRSDLQQFLENGGVDTRTVWSGNVTRHPMMKGVTFRQPSDGLPNSDRVMESGVLLPCSHGLELAELDHVCRLLDEFVSSRP
jgi:CDP-6-deoxy-D-xylo-4-hexulose-3-dehydrase